MIEVRKAKKLITEIIESIITAVLFSLELVFGSEILKLMWAMLFLSCIIFFNELQKAIIFTASFAALMISIVMMFVIVFGYILSKERD